MSTFMQAVLALNAERPAIAAAVQALLDLPAPAAVPAVDYASAGKTLIIGPADIALDWAVRLQDRLDVSVLISEARGGEDLPALGELPIAAGRDISVTGWLGHFTVRWLGGELPAHGPIGALDFSRFETARSERYDLIFDLSRTPLIRIPHPPQGYLAAGRDPVEQFDAVLKLTGLVGEFEKPRFFDYKADLCAHNRNRIEGCHNCIDVCSTEAISSKGDGVVVEPHLCMGCGACASSCPTGAMRYAYPSVPEIALRLKTALAAYRQADGAMPIILFHDRKAESALLTAAYRSQWPHVLPIGLHDIASLGPELLLGALCYGAAHVVILEQAPLTDAYAANLQTQIGLVDTLLEGFGHGRGHCTVVQEASRLPAVLASLDAALALPPASFTLFTDKRRSLDFCIDHLQQHAVTPVTEIALAAGAPYGTLQIDTQRCTLCMACVGSCPAKALQDNPELPQLRFIEHNCVQCGICTRTCPEQALQTLPRLLLTPEARQPRVLNEAQPFHCVRCGTPFGTKAMVDSMLKRLSGHSLFGDEAALRRLQMCGDCRVIDMMEHRKEMTVEDLPR